MSGEVSIMHDFGEKANKWFVYSACHWVSWKPFYCIAPRTESRNLNSLLCFPFYLGLNFTKQDEDEEKNISSF